MVDRNARVVWINERYAARFGIADARQAIGKEIEEIIPTSLMREVATPVGSIAGVLASGSITTIRAGGTDAAAYPYQPEHIVGNILSYPYYSTGAGQTRAVTLYSPHTNGFLRNGQPDTSADAAAIADTVAAQTPARQHRRPRSARHRGTPRSRTGRGCSHATEYRRRLRGRSCPSRRGRGDTCPRRRSGRSRTSRLRTDRPRSSHRPRSARPRCSPRDRRAHRTPRRCKRACRSRDRGSDRADTSRPRRAVPVHSRTRGSPRSGRPRRSGPRRT